MRLIENAKLIERDALTATATFQTASKTVNMKDYNRCLIKVSVTSSGTGSGALTLKQSTVAAGSDEKALAFTSYWYSNDALASDTLTAATATSNTFNVTASSTATRVFFVEVNADALDVDRGFTFLRADIAAVANAIGHLQYFLYEPRQARGVASMPTAIA